MKHVVRIKLDDQIASSMDGNVPLFVPRVGDIILVNQRRHSLVVTHVEIEYRSDSIEIDVFTKFANPLRRHQ